MDLNTMIDEMLPDDSDAKALKRWRKRVALVASSVWLFVFLLLVPFLIFAIGPGVWRLGSVVWASELDHKIEQAIKPVKDDVSEVKKAVDALTEANKASAAASLGNTIIQATREKCKAVSQGRDGTAWADRILELRQKYRDLTDESFDPLTCEDV